MSDYEKEEWWELYKTAVVELEHAKIAGRVHDARTAIVARVEKLSTLPGLHSEEHQAITDALNSLRVLDREEAQYQAGQKQLVIHSALQRLKEIEPTIRRLTGENRTTWLSFLAGDIYSREKEDHGFNGLVTVARYTCSAESAGFAAGLGKPSRPTGAKLTGVKLVRSTRGCVTDWQQETRSLMFFDATTLVCRWTPVGFGSTVSSRTCSSQPICRASKATGIL